MCSVQIKLPELTIFRALCTVSAPSSEQWDGSPCRKNLQDNSIRNYNICHAKSSNLLHEWYVVQQYTSIGFCEKVLKKHEN